MLLIAILLISVIFSIVFHVKTMRKVKLSEAFPGPKAHKFLGNVFNFTFEDPLGNQFVIYFHCILTTNLINCLHLFNRSGKKQYN